MNKTVARIVELLFDGLEESEEIRLLREEVMNNCQERYEDLTAQGLSEDDAIAAVVHSLEGMESMLSSYPRKPAEETARNGSGGFVREEKAGEDPAAALAAMDKAGIRALKISCINADVTVTEGPEISLEYNEENVDVIVAERSGDTLVLRQREKAGNHAAEFTGSFTGILGGLKSFFVNITKTPSIRLSVPAGLLSRAQVQTVSGEVIWKADTEELKIGGNSGDQEVRTGREIRLRNLEMTSMSGDLEVSACADEVMLKTLSGDAEAEVDGSRLTVNTTSGDASFRGKAGNVRIQSVSGDVECELKDGNGDADIFAKSVSGDVTVELPGETEEISLSTHTVSGDVERGDFRENGNAGMRIRAETISGDITVR